MSHRRKHERRDEPTDQRTRLALLFVQTVVSVLKWIDNDHPDWWRFWS